MDRVAYKHIQSLVDREIDRWMGRRLVANDEHTPACNSATYRGPRVLTSARGARVETARAHVVGVGSGVTSVANSLRRHAGFYTFMTLFGPVFVPPSALQYPQGPQQASPDAHDAPAP